MALYAIIAENIWWVCLVIYLILRMPTGDGHVGSQSASARKTC